MRTKETNLQWFARVSHEFCQVFLTCNEHRINYITAEEEIKHPIIEGFYDDVSDSDKAEMIATDTIWKLQIYDRTPIGSYSWYGPTLDSVLTQAREHYRLIEWRRAMRSIE